MRMQLKKMVVLLGVAGAFGLMSASGTRGDWFTASEPIETYCSGHGTFHILEYSEEKYAYKGYCVCNPGWIGARCQIPLTDD